MSSIFPPRLIKYILSNKIFRFKGLANGANGNEKFEVSRTF